MHLHSRKWESNRFSASALALHISSDGDTILGSTQA
jgi:hypothetical protein